MAERAESATRFNATLTGAAEVPAAGDPDGTGTAMVILDVTKRDVCYEVAVQEVDRPVGMHTPVALPAQLAPFDRGDTPDDRPIKAGTFLMYYTVRDAVSGRQCISVATSATLGGPFTDSSSGPLLCWIANGGSIDPSAGSTSAGTYLVEERRQRPRAAYAHLVAAVQQRWPPPGGVRSLLLSANAAWHGSVMSRSNAVDRRLILAEVVVAPRNPRRLEDLPPLPSAHRGLSPDLGPAP